MKPTVHVDDSFIGTGLNLIYGVHHGAGRARDVSTKLIIGLCTAIESVQVILFTLTNFDGVESDETVVGVDGHGGNGDVVTPIAKSDRDRSSVASKVWRVIGEGLHLFVQSKADSKSKNIVSELV